MNLNSHFKTEVQIASEHVDQVTHTGKQSVIEKRTASDKTASAAKTAPSKPTKTQTVIALLRRKNGATINVIAAVIGWQHHSIRGLISGTIKKRLLFPKTWEFKENVP